jgi:hypothetical protein
MGLNSHLYIFFGEMLVQKSDILIISFVSSDHLLHYKSSLFGLQVPYHMLIFKYFHTVWVVFSSMMPFEAQILILMKSNLSTILATCGIIFKKLLLNPRS